MYFQSLQISGPSRKDAGSSGCGRQPPGRPGTALDELVVTRGGKSSRWYIFPMEEASSRPAGPELPWGAGWPPREGRAADGTSSLWRRPAVARPARSCPGELGGHQGREEQPMVHLPYGGGRQSPGQPGAVLESWVATMEEESRRMCHLPHGGGRKPYKERSQVLPDSFLLPLDPIKGNGIRFLLLVCVWPGLARITTTPFHF